MFGIGLPEIIVIFAVALIVVGPDKLPGLARSLAKGMMEMKKTLHQLKDSLDQEDSLDSVQKELRATAEELKGKMIDTDPSHWHPAPGPEKKTAKEAIIEGTADPVDSGPQVDAADGAKPQPAAAHEGARKANPAQTAQDDQNADQSATP